MLAKIMSHSWGTTGVERNHYVIAFTFIMLLYIK